MYLKYSIEVDFKFVPRQLGTFKFYKDVVYGLRDFFAKRARALGVMPIITRELGVEIEVHIVALTRFQ